MISKITAQRRARNPTACLWPFAEVACAPRQHSLEGLFS